MAVTAQKQGLSVVSVASKMSVIIPIGMGVIIYHEVLSALQAAGILLALISVYLVSVKTDHPIKVKTSFLLPAMVFLGSGIIDSALKYFENFYLTPDTIALFSACIFLFAALFGALWIFGFEGRYNKMVPLKSILAGILLGIVNYYSVYFLIQALKIEWLNSATVFTINNVSIVAISSLIGIMIFKEDVSNLNLIGIFLALASIILISVPF